jgi:AcrR family transcriptional regulator
MTTRQLPFFLSEFDAPAKQAILTAALQLFATRGVDGVSVREIASLAGFTNPAMFRHFRSKDALAVSLFEACYRQLAMGLGTAAKQAQPSLRSCIDACLGMIQTSPNAVHFVLDNLRRFWHAMPEDVKRASLMATMKNIVVAEQKKGNLRPSIDPRMVAMLVIGALAQVARMAHFNELPKPAASMGNDLWDLLSRGIGA